MYKMNLKFLTFASSFFAFLVKLGDKHHLSYSLAHS